MPLLFCHRQILVGHSADAVIWSEELLEAAATTTTPDSDLGWKSPDT